MSTKLMIAVSMVVIAVIAGCGGGGGDSSDNGSDGSGERLAMQEAKLLIEHNFTDEDTGFQGFADGDPWNALEISGPSGDPVLTVMAQGGLFDFGLTELFFETSEPANDEVPIEDVLARLAQGDYSFMGEIVDAPDDTITATLTHQIPSGPTLLAPVDGSTVDPDNGVVVSWNPVAEDIDGSPVTIVGYQVLVEKVQEPPLFPQGFAETLFSAFLPSSVTSVTVPAEFFETDACYEYEVLAIEESGNQTISLAEFETGSGCAEPPPEDETPQLRSAKLLIEHNASDQDTGFQGFADGDPWNQLAISGPGDETILTAVAENGLFDFGLTEFFFETSEPENADVPIAQVLARLPEGIYTFTGDLVDGGQSTLTATLSHTIPAGPVLVSPPDGATVDPDGVVIAWQPVSRDITGGPVNIVGYQVIVEIDAEPQFPQSFARTELSIHLPGTATSITIPAEFLQSGESYAYEVLAIEESGNQTISSAEFETN